MHAGLIGADAWAVLDEAHLVPPFEALLRAVAAFDPVAPVPRFRATSLSATGRSGAERAFALDEDDIRGDERARKRLNATKRLTLREAPKVDLAKAMAACAVELSNEGGRRIIVFANSRKTAQQIAALIERAAQKPALLVGARRVRERELLKADPVFQRFSPNSNRSSEPAFLVATSAGEVGVDLDADALVCDLAPWERMVQRFGRVNRRAEPGEAPVVVFDAIEDDDEDQSENSTEARKAAKSAGESIKAAFRELFEGDWWPANDDGAREASPLALQRLKTAAADYPALRELLERATTPEPLRPAPTPALLDAWSMTSLEEHTGRPIVEPWLRGWVDKEPQTRVLWRAILPPVVPRDDEGNIDRNATEARLKAFFDAAPPHLTEMLETYSIEVADVVNKRVVAVSKRAGRPPPSSAEMGENSPEPLRGGDVAAVILSLANDVERFATLSYLAANPLHPRDLISRTIVMDARLGGLDKDGLLDPNADAMPRALDDDLTWSPDREKIGFHIGKAMSAGSPTQGCRIGFRCPVSNDDEDAEGEEIRVGIYRKGRDAAGDLAISSEPQTLDDHTKAIVSEVERLVKVLGLAPELAAVLRIAARLHDLGKSRKLWQRAMGAPNGGAVYAKTEGGGNPALLRLGEETYRHEFGSLREAESDAELNSLIPELRDLALHLIASHHGFARPVIAAVDPDEPLSQSAARAPDIALRYIRLQKRWGWWGLAWIEALLRAADWLASAAHDSRANGNG